MAETTLTIETSRGAVSAILEGPDASPMLVLAHGAGSDMRHPFLEGFARGLVAGGVACLRFNFPYTEAGRRAPDR